MDLPTPQFDLPAPKWDRPAMVAKADPVPTRPVKVAAPGYHVHRDAAGREWSHSDASKGDRAAHLSPFDGSGPYWNPVQTGVRIVNYPELPDSSPSVTYTLPASSGGCPPGGCPTAAPTYYQPRPLLRLFR